MARREFEYKQAQMISSINGDKNVAHRAHWEAKTNKLVENHLVRSRIADMKRREQTNLESRRHKLAAMLAAEESQYEKEFQDNLETPEQVREKMFDRMQHLKQKREAERQSEVDRRMD